MRFLSLRCLLVFLCMSVLAAGAEETVLLNFNLKVEFGSTQFVASPKVATHSDEAAEIAIEDDNKILKVSVLPQVQPDNLIALTIKIEATAGDESFRKSLNFVTVAGKASQFKDTTKETRFLLSVEPTLQNE